MKKLITGLMLVLPVLLIIAVFAVTDYAKLSYSIPANGLSILNKGEDGVFNFDIAEYDQTNRLYEEDLGVTVFPYEANNRNYSLSVVDAESGNASDIVEIVDGYFTFKDIGRVKLNYTSADGGYSDSVLFNVTCTQVLDFQPLLSDATESAVSLTSTEQGYSADISGGYYHLATEFYPKTSGERVSYSTEDSSIELDEAGNLSIMFSGRHVITATTQGVFGTISKQIELNVAPENTTTINGGAVACVVSPKNSLTETLYVETTAPTSATSISVSNPYIATASVSAYDDSGRRFIVDLTYAEHPQEFEMVLSIGSDNIEVDVRFAEYDFSVYTTRQSRTTEQIVMLSNASMAIGVSSNPKNSSLTYDWFVSNTGVAEIVNDNGSQTLRAVGVGRTTLIITAYERKENGDLLSEYDISREIIVTPQYTSILFAESAGSYGLGTLAIASKKFTDSGVVAVEYASLFSGYKGTTKLSAPYSDIAFTSSNTAIAETRAAENGVFINVKSDGEVTITATWEYGAMFGVSSTEFKFTAVDGVSVGNNAELTRASESKMKCVLSNDISLGEELFNYAADGSRTLKNDKATTRTILNSYTKTIATTADWTYYKNLGVSQPSVRYCMEFSNDVYGNGHTIDGTNITDMLDSTDNLYECAVFNGPLDFVSTSRMLNGDSIKVAAVKGQDNIVFLVKEDDVVLDNVCLKSVRDDRLYDNGEMNLTLLNYAGTTLEVMCNAEIRNCRISNGRTVVRIYGRTNVNHSSNVNPTREKINAVIDNCVLQNAREFVLKIGTNRALRSEENIAPFLTDANANNYTAYNSAECDNYINDQYFVDNYVLTDVVLKDSIIATSGLFSIGIESHFSGGMLNGGSSFPEAFRLDGWEDLAATSYPSALHLVGNVLMDDWKDLSLMDSSTLIETDVKNHTIDSDLDFLQLDICAMLTTVKQYGGASYNNVIATDDNGKEYVHGGIALYGGGKNYSIVDCSLFTGETLNNYCVNLSILEQSEDINLKNQGRFLPWAAGEEDFRFLIYDSTSNYGYDD